jgi:hypothetical protein
VNGERYRRNSGRRPSSFEVLLTGTNGRAHYGTAYENQVRVGPLVLVSVLLSGCSINFVKKSSEPERLKQRVEYFKWLYQKGFYNSDPEMMKMAASKLLEVDVREREEVTPQTEVLERLLKRLEEDIERLAKERR